MAYFSNLLNSGLRHRDLLQVTLNRLPYSPVIPGLLTQVVVNGSGTAYGIPSVAINGSGRMYSTQVYEANIDSASSMTMDSFDTIGPFAIPFQKTDGTQCCALYSWTDATHHGLVTFEMGAAGSGFLDESEDSTNIASADGALIPVGEFSGYLYLIMVADVGASGIAYAYKIDLSDGSITDIDSDTETTLQSRWTVLPSATVDSMRIIQSLVQQADETVDNVVWELDGTGGTLTSTTTDGLDLTSVDGTIATMVAGQNVTSNVIVGSDDELYLQVFCSGELWYVNLEVSGSNVVSIGTNNINTATDLSALGNAWALTKDLIQADVWYLTQIEEADLFHAVELDFDFSGGSVSVTTDLSNDLTAGVSAQYWSRTMVVNGKMFVGNNTPANQGVVADGNNLATAGKLYEISPSLRAASGSAALDTEIDLTQWFSHQPEPYADNGCFIQATGAATTASGKGIVSLFSPWALYTDCRRIIPSTNNDDLEYITPIAHCWGDTTTTVYIDTRRSLGPSGTMPAGMTHVVIGGKDYPTVPFGDNKFGFTSHGIAGSMGLDEGYNCQSAGRFVVAIAVNDSFPVILDDPHVVYKMVNTVDTSTDMIDIGNFIFSDADADDCVVEAFKCY